MDVLIASNQRDAKAVQDVIEQHAAITGALLLAVEDLVAAASRSEAMAVEQARDRLLRWCRAELLPRAAAEESVLYPEAERTPEGKLLVATMVDEHNSMRSQVGRIADATEPMRAVMAAAGLAAVLEVHLDKESQHLLPLLASMPGVSIADCLDRMHAQLAQHDLAQQDSHSTNASIDGNSSINGGEDMNEAEMDTKPPSGSCGCGHHDDGSIPELDVQAIPHTIRHATIFGALDALTPGTGLIISATHDPVPLLTQLSQRSPGAFDTNYVERGPERWRVHFQRN